MWDDAQTSCFSSNSRFLQVIAGLFLYKMDNSENAEHEWSVKRRVDPRWISVTGAGSGFITWKATSFANFYHTLANHAFRHVRQFLAFTQKLLHLISFPLCLCISNLACVLFICSFLYTYWQSDEDVFVICWWLALSSLGHRTETGLLFIR